MKYYVIAVAVMLFVSSAGCRSQKSATIESSYQADTLRRESTAATMTVREISDIELVLDSVQIVMTDGSVASAQRATLRRRASGTAELAIVSERVDSTKVCAEEKRTESAMVRREHSRSLPWLAVAAAALALIGLSYAGIRLRR